MADAAEVLPLFKVGSETYSNVMVINVTATDLYFTFDKGMANAKLKQLDPVWQKHFHYDAAKADAIEQQKKVGTAQYRLPGVGATNRGSGLTTAKSGMDEAAIKSETEEAMSRVREIVNQPVTSLTVTPDMQVATYRPGWFHEGAEKPNFNTVDIRIAQQLTYDQHDYVT